MAATPLVARSISLRRNVAWTFAGNALYAACQWLMLSALTKLSRAERVGEFALCLAITAPVVMLTNLQLRAVFASDAERRFKFSDYWTLRLAGCAVALAIIVGIGFAGDYGPGLRGAIIAMGAAKCVEALSDVVYGLLQRDEDMARIARSMVLRGVLALTAFVATVHMTDNLVDAIIAIGVVWALVFVGCDWPSARRHRRLYGDDAESRAKANTSRVLATLFRTSLPLGMTMLLISLNTNVPRYFIEHALGRAPLGVYAALSSPLVAGLMVVTALGQSAMPRLARFATGGDFAGFRRLTIKLIGLGAALGASGVVVSLVAGRIILRLLFAPIYAQYADIFVWLNVVAAIGYVASFLGYGLTALHRFDIQVPLMICVTGTAALGSWILVPPYGLFGAVMALLLSAVVQLIGCAGVVWHDTRVPSRTAEAQVASTS